jgi:hypothetical protein
MMQTPSQPELLHLSEGSPAMRAKQFFYLSASLLLLVVAYTVGASRAKAQATGSSRIVAASPFGQNNSNVIVVQEDGRVFLGYMAQAPGSWQEMTPVPSGSGAN